MLKGVCSCRAGDTLRALSLVSAWQLALMRPLAVGSLTVLVLLGFILSVRPSVRPPPPPPSRGASRTAGAKSAGFVPSRKCLIFNGGKFCRL